VDEVITRAISNAAYKLPLSSSDEHWLLALEARARARMPFTVESLGFTLEFRPASDPERPTNVGGLTDPSTRSVVVWPERSWGEDEVVRVLAHELGHVLDSTCMTRRSRRAFLKARGLHHRVKRWYRDGGGPSLASAVSRAQWRELGCEVFADSFAHAVTGVRTFRTLGGEPMLSCAEDLSGFYQAVPRRGSAAAPTRAQRLARRTRASAHLVVVAASALVFLGWFVFGTLFLQ
jgi:hypothetical protein